MFAVWLYTNEIKKISKTKILKLSFKVAGFTLLNVKLQEIPVTEKEMHSRQPRVAYLARTPSRLDTKKTITQMIH